ncbi:MAG: hypothetical protein Q8K78_07840 [Planctomycetaceae bacterium]|nr:hypothetical protein [Planctomycetaceae bacterium]
MALDYPSALRTPTVLPSYAHPPLVTVRMGIRCPLPVVIDTEVFAGLLGPTWLKSDRLQPSPQWTRMGFAEETLQAAFAGVLGDQHLEVQANGIDFHWDGRSGESYPHYETLRDAFVTAFDAWSQSASVSSIVPQRWHVSYWNRIPQGTVWSKLDDLRFCRLLASAGETPFATRLIDFQQTWIYREAESPSQLRCDAWLERNEQSLAENVIWLALTSTGQADDPQLVPDDVDNDWLSGLDTGRRAIVSGFRGLMSVHANAYWGLAD